MGVVYCFYSNQLLSFFLFTISLFLLLFTYSIFCENDFIQGRYTRDLSDYHLVIPRKVDHSGNFLSYKLPSYYTRDYKKRRKRQTVDGEKVHYHLEFDGRVHHLELWPNHGFLAPNAVIEENTRDKRNVKARWVNPEQCHYTGIVRDIRNSRVAISLCNDGLAGSVYTDRGHYLVEPVHEHGANTLGQHLHVVHQRGKRNRATTRVRDAASKYRAATDSTHNRECGAKSWEQGWADSFRYKYRKELEDARVDREGEEEEGNEIRSGNRRHQRQELTLSLRHHFIEVMIVADKKFLEFHQGTDYESYLLTIMNMVSNFYHDASLGQHMDVIITRILYLHKEEEEIDLDINPDADATLASFCQWAKKANLPSGHPNHYDVAALITRHNICVTEEDSTLNCGLLGIAEVSGACRPEGACSVNQDSGLELGIVLSHELGHLLGSNHDDPSESECEAKIPNRQGEFFYVMAPYIRVATVEWSRCSKIYVQTFFTTGLGNCLEDEPREAKFTPKEVLPGVVYDADFQCKSLNGLSSCMGVDCKELHCYLDKIGGTCGTYPTVPPFDGTECGTNKWCIKTECVDKGSRPKAVDGGWSDWSPISECSRTCGGGVQFQERECDNPMPSGGGKMCYGQRKKYFICNTKPCDCKAPSFKDFQCAKKLNKNGEEYVSYSSPRQQTNNCKIYCLLKPAGPLELLPAEDGTKCKPGTKNICVENTCQPVGCDWVFGSPAIEDRCGVCKGDGSTCTVVTEKFDQEPTRSLTKMFDVPVNVRSIHIAQINDDSQGSWMTVAVVDVDTQAPTLVLGTANYKENDTQMDIAGSSLIYTHQKTGKENLWIHDTIRKPLKIYLSAPTKKNPGYTMTYVVPEPQVNPPRKFSWEVTEFTPCSARCGGGTQESIPVCVDDEAGKVDISNCKEPKPAIITIPCNTKPCNTKWRVGNWGKCTGCKFRIGFKRREVICVTESKHPDTDDVIEDAAKCREKKPHRLELCISARPCNNITRRDTYIDEGVARKLWHQIRKHKKRSDVSKFHGDRKHYVFHLLENYDPYSNAPLPVNASNDLIECFEVTDTNNLALGNSGEIVTVTLATNAEIITTESVNTGETVKLDVGKTVKDYEPKENRVTVIQTTKNAPILNLNDENFEKQGADVFTEGSAMENITQFSIIEKNTLSAN